MERVFKSKTYGLCSFDEVMKHIATRIKNDEQAGYLLAIGTDSQNHATSTRFANIIMLHTLGRGGIYFYLVRAEERINVLPNRMLEEAHQSIDIAKDILNWFDEAYDEETFDYSKYNIKMEIHCDVGVNGASRDAIKSVLGWIHSEFGDSIQGMIKPSATVASGLADKYVR